MTSQSQFRFISSPCETLSFARLGFALHWRRIERRARQLFALHLREAADQNTRTLLLTEGFDWREHFTEIALLEEIRRNAKRTGRSIRKQERAQGRRLSAGTAFAVTVEGQRTQRVLEQLAERVRAWEAARLCG